MSITAPTIDLATTGTDPKLTTLEELEADVNGAFNTLTDDINTTIDSVIAAGGILVGDWAASSGAFPTLRPSGGTIKVGDMWRVTDSDTVDGESFVVGDYLQAIIAGGGVTFSGNWSRAATGQLIAAAAAADLSADQAALYEGVWLNDVAAVVADTTLTYSAGAGQVTVGQYVRTRKEGFSYKVLASGAATYDVITAGSVKVDLMPGPDGAYNFAGMAPAADGVTDDYAKLRKLLDKPSTGSGYYQSITPIHIPNGDYYIGQTLELKKSVRIFGNSSGLPWDDAATLIWPANTMGIVVNRFNTLNGGVEGVPTTAADGSVIEGIRLACPTVGTDKTKHGIWLRARAVIRNVMVSRFAGNGINVVATAGGSSAEEGNANNFTIDTVRVEVNGGHGLFVDGADTNAGLIRGVDATANGRCGIYDAGFLGNTYVACHTDSNGLASVGANAADQSAFVTYGGNRYAAHWTATEAELVATTPGTDSTVWILDGVGGVHSSIPLWTAGKPSGTYFVAFPYFSDNANARNTFVGCYTESGQPRAVLLTPSLAVGGLMSIYEGAHLSVTFGDIVTGTGGIGARTGVVDVTVGPGGGEKAVGTLLYWEAVEETGLPWRFQYDATNNNYVVKNGNLDSRIAALLTSGDTTTTMGTSGPVPYIFTFPTIGIGSGATLRRRTVGVGPPASGAWAKGDRVDNYDPGASSVKYWLCTVAGTPGTWTAFGAQAAARADVSGAATLADLITAFNDLLAKMRTANQLAP